MSDARPCQTHHLARPRVMRLLAAALLITLTGCDVQPGNESGFRTSEPQRMAKIKKALAREGIPFREDADGSLWFENRHKTAVDAVVAATDGSHVTRNIRLEDPELAEVALRALSEKGIEGTLDGSGVSWTTAPEEDTDAVSAHVHAALSAHLAKAATGCAPRPAPCTR
ncbi:MAG: hypothetical protein MUF55_03615 [Hydrogenophaga sp.]|nr:hypothetical protein [Hydrogenophaga sp.]